MTAGPIPMYSSPICSQLRCADCETNPGEEYHLKLESVCVLRLSALGDVCHVVPLVRALQDQLPDTRVTWIIGRTEAKLVGDLDGVEFLVFDKSAGRRARHDLSAALAGRRFGALLLPQRSLRANLLSRLVQADVRVGFDRARSRELHGWFVNRRIAPRLGDQHVLDAVLSFLVPLGLVAPAAPRWDIPLSPDDRAFAAEHIVDDGRTLILSPAASVERRCWDPARYATLVDHAVKVLGYRVVLCGGRTPFERTLGDAILSRTHAPVVDMIGKDSLKQFLAMVARAALLVTPDSGPAHMGTAMGTPVLGLYAATDCMRSGPYHSRGLCVNRFDEAARRFLRKDPSALAWGRHIHHEGVMELVETADVIDQLDAFTANMDAGYPIPDAP